MGNLVRAYAEKFKHTKQMRRRVVSILAVLALIVSCGVFWELHSDGVAMANETFCGMEEHQHGEDCYEQVLVCGEESKDEEDEESADTAAHVHDDFCYETVLTCDIPEHTHSITCLSDDTADVETSSDWVATLPIDLTGIWADDVVSIAKSQIGYTESEANFQLAEDGETRQGYSRYGAWYGNEYGDWDAMFASFCLHYAGVPESIFPEASGAYAWITELKEKEDADPTGDARLYADAKDYIPKPGDLIFFDTDEDGKADHVGIVQEVETKGADTDTAAADVIQKIAVIEGDSNDIVEKNVYDFTSGKSEDSKAVSTIKAYGILPEQTDTVVAEDVPVTLTYTDTDYTVTVTYDSGADLPEGTELAVSEYDQDSEAYLARYEEAAKFYGWNDDTNDETEDGSDNETDDAESEETDVEDAEAEDKGSHRNIRLFNIGLSAPDEEGEMTSVEPDASAEICITFTEAPEDTEYSVACFDPEIATSDIACETGEDDSESLTFVANNLSDFMVISSVEETDENDSESDIMPLNGIGDIDLGADGHHDDYGNYWTYLDTGISPVSSENKLELRYANMSADFGSTISVESDSHTGRKVLLVDLDSVWSTFESRVTSTSSANGYNLSNLGTIRFGNAGTINGVTVDVLMTFDSVSFYGSYRDGYLSHYSGSVVNTTNHKIAIGSVTTGNALWLGLNYNDNTDAARERYNNTYSYPCVEDVQITVQVVQTGTNTVMNNSFLQVASDIDIERYDDYRGTWAETFRTVSGFNGNYYVYTSDADHIVVNGLGQITVSAEGRGDGSNDSGTGSYTAGGVYAETTGGTWTVSYTEGYCSTEVEIYQTVFDITVKKVDAVDQNTLIPDADFVLYYNATDSNGAVTGTYYYIYSGGTTSWTTNRNEATILTTNEQGIAEAHSLTAGTYYLEEVNAPDGYNILDHVIEFDITPYGIIECEDADVVLDESGSLVITVLNHTSAELPNTGGPGVLSYMLIGLLLTGGAAFLLLRRRKEAMRCG